MHGMFQASMSSPPTTTPTFPTPDGTWCIQYGCMCVHALPVLVSHGLPEALEACSQQSVSIQSVDKVEFISVYMRAVGNTKIDADVAPLYLLVLHDYGLTQHCLK